MAIYKDQEQNPNTNNNYVIQAWVIDIWTE